MPAPVGLLVRGERSGDPGEVATIRAVVRRAFGQEDEADLLDALRADPAWLPDLALVALLGPAPGGPVVGHVAGTRLDVGGGAAVALAPLAVDPDHQRRGVGSALVEAQLAAARGLGERLVVVLGDPAYYSRFGFRPARELGITGPYDDAGEAFQALPLTDGPLVSGWATYAAPFGG
ncbi:MAG TPA: N-acetyltransferase [Jiangellales bacterium]|nr:N-acetyltransferase [Jiangellales bacterium]